jgi:hypothetical protein
MGLALYPLTIRWELSGGLASEPRAYSGGPEAMTSPEP